MDVPVAVVAQSIMEHTSSDDRIHIHLVTPKEDEARPWRFPEIGKRFANLETHIVGVAYESLGNLPDGKALPSHVSRATYLKLATPEVLHQPKRLIMLDADVLVRSDLAALWRLEMGEKVSAAAMDYGIPTIDQGLPTTWQGLGREGKSPNFNSGVFVVNSPEWHRAEITRLAFEYIDKNQKDLRWAEQEAYNAMCGGHVLPLDVLWNVQLGAIEYYDRVGYDPRAAEIKARRDELLCDAKVVHFIGPAKPWNDGLRLPYRDEYLECMRRALSMGKSEFNQFKLRLTYQCLSKAVKRRINLLQGK